MSVFTTLGALAQFKYNTNDIPYWYWTILPIYANGFPVTGNQTLSVNDLVAFSNTTNESFLYAGLGGTGSQIGYINKITCTNIPITAEPSLTDQKSVNFQYSNNVGTTSNINFINYDQSTNSYISVSRSDVGTNLKVVFADFDSNANHIGNTHFEYSYNGRFNDIAVKTSGNYNVLVGGNTGNYTGIFASFLGNTINVQKTANQYLSDIVVNGNICVVATGNSIFTTDVNLSSVTWNKQYTYGNNLFNYKIIPTDNNNYVVFGQDANTTNGIFYKIDSNGNVLWSKQTIVGNASVNSIIQPVNLVYNDIDDIIIFSSKLDYPNNAPTAFPGLSFISNDNGSLLTSYKFKFAFMSNPAQIQANRSPVTLINSNSNVILLGSDVRQFGPTIEKYPWSIKVPGDGQILGNGTIIPIQSFVNQSDVGVTMTTVPITWNDCNLSVSNGNITFSNITTGIVSNITPFISSNFVNEFINSSLS